MMLDCLRGTRNSLVWLHNGGDATLRSYGVEPPVAPFRQQDVNRCTAALGTALPPSHKAFLEGLKLHHVEGDYCFVHAGLRPGVPLHCQEPDDLTWIRSEFLECRANFGCVVVHGHTITPQVDVRPNRIGIDTGAYWSDRLTCLVLWDGRRDFLQT